MSKFHIMAIAVNDSHRMYDELIAVVGHSLVDLGHECSAKQNFFATDAANILIGSTIFAARHLDLVTLMRDRSYIVYQLEQLDDVRGLLPQWPEYMEVLRNARSIWDYAPSSAQYLRERGFSQTVYLPPGFHPCLATFAPAAEPDIDVAFFGAPHPRRMRLHQELAARGAKVAFMAKAYGAERDGIIARARIALNVHAWDDLNILETVRMSHLLANRCFVISETSDHNPYADGVVYADYDALAVTCFDYLARPRAARDAIAEKGHAAVKAQNMAELMRAVIG